MIMAIHQRWEPRGNDPVEQIGRDIGRAWAALDRFDDINEASPPDAKPAEALQERIYQQLYQLEEALPALRASSVAGALIMLIRASGVAETIRTQIPGPDDNKLLRNEEHWRNIEAWWKDLQSLLYSAAGVLRKAAPGVFETCAGQPYMPDYSDPFNAMERVEEMPIPQKHAA